MPSSHLEHQKIILQRQQEQYSDLMQTAFKWMLPFWFSGVMPVTENNNENAAWEPIPMIIVTGIAFRIAGEKFSWNLGAILPLLFEKETGGYSIGGLGGDRGLIPIPLFSLTYRID